MLVDNLVMQASLVMQAMLRDQEQQHHRAWGETILSMVAVLQILFQNSSYIFTFRNSSVRPSVLKRDMNMYANIYTDFEPWFQYISCSHDQTRLDQTRPQQLRRLQ